MENLVQITDGKVVVSSRQVAEHFGKLHKDVLAGIENIRAENSALTSMFDKTSYTAGTGKSYPEYLMNRDGFSLLVMGFTGKKSLEWKIKYIQAFNAMEEELRNPKKKEPTLRYFTYNGERVFLFSDVGARLGVTKALCYWLIKSKLKRDTDYTVLRGNFLKRFKTENKFETHATALGVIFTSAISKLMPYRNTTPASVVPPKPALPIVPNTLNTFANPEGNKDIAEWAKSIRGYMDVLDGLLHKYAQKNPVTTQEALKEVMRSVGRDILEDTVRLTCQKYEVVTI